MTVLRIIDIFSQTSEASNPSHINEAVPKLQLNNAVPVFEGVTKWQPNDLPVTVAVSKLNPDGELVANASPERRINPDPRNQNIPGQEFSRDAVYADDGLHRSPDKRKR